jgi:hypothetical protein
MCLNNIFLGMFEFCVYIYYGLHYQTCLVAIIEANTYWVMSGFRVGLMFLCRKNKIWGTSLGFPMQYWVT